MKKGTIYSELEEVDFPSDEDERLWGGRMVIKETIVFKWKWFIE